MLAFSFLKNIFYIETGKKYATITNGNVRQYFQDPTTNFGNLGNHLINFFLFFLLLQIPSISQSHQLVSYFQTIFCLSECWRTLTFALLLLQSSDFIKILCRLKFTAGM